MGKLPYFPFYPGDWLSDPCLRRCSLEVKGLWIEMLSLMWVSVERGVLSGTASELSRMCGLSESNFENLVLELGSTGTASVSIHNGLVTVMSRRMVRDEEDRKNNAKRQSRYRRKKGSNGNVTWESHENNGDTSYSASYSASKDKELVRDRFDEFWNKYPKKQGKKDALSAFVSLNPDEKLMSVIIKHVELQKKSKQWKDDGGTYIPLPGSYIRGERWLDEGTKISKRGESWDN